MEAAVAVGRPRGIARWTALAGAVYVVLFVVGTIVLFSGSPAGDAAPAKVIQWYSDSGHRDRVNIGWILIGLGIFFLLWFIATLRRAVMAVDAEGILTAVVTIGGSVYAAVAFASVAVNAGIRTMSDDTYQHRVFPELIHAADDVGYVMHATGAAALGAMIIAVSLAFMWAAVWPKWAGWLGVIVGILAIGAIFFFTQFLFLLWILVVSIVLFLRSAPDPRTV
ncbi:MAG: hypothetical protein E6G03_02305 [Actinobacteria bacterium]|nr:MAG: hypothetical protein E6G03_02305 [Actinomycetota bacterium]